MSRKYGYLGAIAMISELGLIMLVCVVISIILGGYLDAKFGTSPVFLGIFAFFGVGAAIRNLYLFAMRETKKSHKGRDNLD